MADKNKKADAEQAPPKKSKKKKLLLLLVLLILVGGGGAAYKFMFGGKLPFIDGGADKSEEEKEAEKTVVQANLPQQPGQVVPLETFLVNLSDPLGRRYIKITFEVEVTDAETAVVMEQQKARVRDAIILLLTSKTYADLALPESKLMLKDEVVQRLTQIMGGPKIQNVYITDMVIQ